MKRNIATRLSALLLVLATLSFVACTEETSDNRLAPNLATTQVINITSNSATVVGYIIAGTEQFTERGVCYSTSPEPTMDGSFVKWVNDGSKKATFQVSITDLTHT